ncbi:MAG: hypothetical protein ONB46_06720 [candidate division KSB1 bacterium]|nr:hypothetical protein [candidate division KSB1 bacterium]MDZ7367204.1 hypothetical protein [candidate division KSB1 bacterium]MDZ7405313.1 hypothetical protein [candidate division KSB1 bacterium]
MRKFFSVLFFSTIFVLLVAANNPPSAALKGVVLYNRPAPVVKPLAVTRDRAACGENIPDETLIVHAKGGLQNVLIFLANIKAEALPAATLNLDIKACRFQPRVLALGAGGHLLIRNGDPILHDVHARWRPFAGGWNETSTLNIFGSEQETYFHFVFHRQDHAALQKLDKPGLLQLRSDVGHDWMRGYILVMPHRYFAVTDAQGKFELPKLPLGRYDLVMWHESLGAKRQIVAVEASGKNELLLKWFPDDSTTAGQADSAVTN